MLDELGQNIIKELQEDARQSFREIGRKLDVSEGTVRNRVKSLMGSQAMRISGWVFLIASWTFILALTIFCFYRVFAKKKVD